jgi:hypothetical protein
MPEKTFTTSDLATAAYLHMKGMRLVKADKDRGSRFTFIFDDTNSTAEALAYEFINSECSKFDNHVRLLKKMIYNH